MLKSLRSISYGCSALLQPPSTSHAAQIRNTWIMKRVHVPAVTPEGQVQRLPDELKELQRYEVVRNENDIKAPPIELILLQDVEGIGHQFDTVSVASKVAREDLLLSRKAVYTSPYDVVYYANMKEKMKDELSRRIRLPYELLQIGRDLQKLIVSIKVNMDRPWTLSPKILKTSLRQMGVDVSHEEDLHLPPSYAFKGPNFDMEAKLIRFYVVVNRLYVVPMIGRITHISADQAKQMLIPDKLSIKQDELTKEGIVNEQPYYHNGQPIDYANFDVVNFMTNRRKQY